jgi:hypothetical protein
MREFQRERTLETYREPTKIFRKYNPVRKIPKGRNHQKES